MAKRKPIPSFIHSQESFLNEAKRKWGNKYDYTQTVYLGNRKQIKFSCPVHGSKSDVPLNHIRFGCYRCHKELVNDPFIAIAKENWREKLKSGPRHEYDYNAHCYDYDPYYFDKSGKNDKVHYFCRKHYSVVQLRSEHLEIGCPHCAKGQIDSVFVTKAKKKWGNKCDYQFTQFRKNNIPISYSCQKHGFLSQKPLEHLKIGCMWCHRDILMQPFIEKAKIKWGEAYDYSYSKNQHFHSIDKIYYKCKKHNFSLAQDQKEHLEIGCPHCAKENDMTSCPKEFSQSTFFTELHADRMSLSTPFGSMKLELILRCPVHGDFICTDRDPVSVKGCPHCNNFTSYIRNYIPINLQEDFLNFVEGLGHGIFTRNNATSSIFFPQMKIKVEYFDFAKEDPDLSADYFQMRADSAEKEGIHLIQVFDHEWKYRKAIVKSRLSSIFGKNRKIHARKTQIEVLSKPDKDTMLLCTHLQGTDESTVGVGLIYEGNRVAVMTFRRSEGIYDHELVRCSCRLGVNIVGGFEKLLTAFCREQEGSIVTYGDRRWTNGHLYKTLGFKEAGITLPDYIWYHNSRGTILYPDKLNLKGLEHYHRALNEGEILKLNGYCRVWNAGYSRWVLE